MLETPHVAVGVAIASKIPNPLIAAPLSLASHFIFEKIPHWNPHLNSELKKYGQVTRKSTLIVAIDVILSLIIGIYFSLRVLPDTNHALTILACSFISVLPDVVEGPYFFLKSKGKLIEKWVGFQKSIQVDTTLVPGLLTQILTVVLSLWFVTH